MKKEFKFKKTRILFGIIILGLFLVISVSFILSPENYIRNIFSTQRGIRTLGTVGVLFFSSMLYAYVAILPRKYSIQITDDFLIDNSKYESLGKIEWKDIAKVERIKKYSIKLTLNKSVFKSKKINLFKRFLRYMTNWDYKNSIIISSALSDCTIDELFNNILENHKKYKKRNR